MGRLLVGFLTALLWLATAGAGTASAHAVVLASSPGDRVSLTEAPAEVRITFSESVDITLGGLEVLDGDGTRVDAGTTDQPAPDTVRTRLRDGLGEGTYIANYRVVSADGHAITGAIVFGVGVNVDEGAAAGVTEEADAAWEAAGAVARSLGYLGALGAAGAAFFLAFLGDGAAGTVAVGRWVRRLAGLGGIGAVASIAVQASLATGRGPSAAVDTAVLREVLKSGLGWQTAAVFGGLAAVVLVPIVRGVTAQVLALYGGLTTAGAFILWGHALEAEPAWIAMAADGLHAVVAALWLGGVVALSVLLRARLAGRAHAHDGPYREDPVLASARLVVGFSTTAAVAVAVLWIAGTVVAWDTVGSIEALTGSRYGLALLAKLATVAAVLAVAGYNRFRLVPAIIDDAEPVASAVTTATPAHADPASSIAEHTDDGEPGAATGSDPSTEQGPPTGPDAAVGVTDRDLAGSPEPAWRRLSMALRVELTGLVAVLLITGALVNTTPPSQAQGQADRPFTQTQQMRTAQLAIVVSPATTGANAIHLTYTDKDGRPVDLVRKATVLLALRDKNIGPISREPVKAATGHYILEGITDFAVPGTWSVTVESRTGEFDVERTEFLVPIRKA